MRAAGKIQASFRFVTSSGVLKINSKRGWGRKAMCPSVACNYFYNEPHFKLGVHARKKTGKPSKEIIKISTFI